MGWFIKLINQRELLMKPNFYTIFDIKNNIDQVTLPAIQRGFVWKTEQMCYLWDSLLRGYPIGSFLASKNGSCTELLDGQQRMTTILSGFYNPFGENQANQILSLKKPPVLWIDLLPHSKPKDNVYSVLICTQSHPWGYRADNPGERISTSKMRKFLDDFGIDGNSYYHLSPNQYYPIDSSYPIPLSFVLESFEQGKDINLRIELLKKKLLTNCSLDYNSLEGLDTKLNFLFQSIDLASQVFIPELLIDLSKVKLTDDEMVDEDSRDPTLFVRLNQNGTNIDNEELIYSYYKSFFPKVKLLIESIGQDYISAKMILNIFSRFAYFSMDVDGAHYRNPFALEGFKKAFVNNDVFKQKLTRLLPEQLNKDQASAAMKLNNFIEFFEDFEKDESYKIPKTLIKSMMRDTNLVYIFLCFIEKISLYKVSLTKKNKNSIVSFYFYVHLFSIKKTKIYKPLFEQLIRNYAGEDVNVYIGQVLEKLQYCYIDETSDKDFERKLFKITSIGLVFDAIIKNKCSFHDLDLFNKMCDENKDFKESFYINGNQNNIFISFMDRLRSNKEILLLAQRRYINKKFKAFESIDLAEDTNRPWDYDHIYPKNWVYARDGDGRMMNNIHWLVKEWINTNGNYRALDFSTNRSERDQKTPFTRLKDEQIRNDSFISKFEYDNYWSKFEKRQVITKDDDNLTIFLNAVLNRTATIYKDVINSYLIFEK